MSFKMFVTKESIFLLLITTLLSYYISPLFLNPQYDRQVFIYGSMTILKGGAPYRDFFDHKPPFIYLILAIGWPLKWWGVWIVGVLSKWVTTVFLYKAGAKYNVSLKLLAPLAFLIVLLDPFLICMGSFTREYSAVFIGLTISLILLSPGKNFIATGLLFGLTFFTQQEEIIALIPYILWHLFTTSSLDLCFKLKLFFERVIKLITGFLIVAVPLCIWLFAKNAFSAFWDQAFIFNFFSYPPNSDLDIRLQKSLLVLYHTRVGFFIAFFLLLHLYTFYKTKRYYIHLIAFSSIFLFSIYKLLFTRLGENNDAQHYLLGFSPLFATSLILIQQELKQILQNTKLKIAVIIMFYISSWFLWENALTSKYTVKEEENYTRFKKILPLIEDVRNKDGQIYVFRNTSLIFIYNELNALSPSKWIFTTMYDQHLKFDPERKVMKEIIGSLEINKTRYIVDMSTHDPLNVVEMQKQWDTYTQLNYKIIFSAAQYRVLERKNRL